MRSASWKDILDALIAVLDATLVELSFPGIELGRDVTSRVRRYLNIMKTRLSSSGQLVLPAELRQRDGLEPGQEFEIKRLEAGQYRLVRSTRPANQGPVDWLLSCPEKGYFVAIESDWTESL